MKCVLLSVYASKHSSWSCETYHYHWIHYCRSGASDVPEMKQEYGSPQPTGMVTNEGYEPLPFHTPQRPTDTPNSMAGSSYDQSIQ